VRKGMVIRQCREQDILAPVTAIDFIDPGGHVVLRIQTSNPTDEAAIESQCTDGSTIELIDR
jgi:hypothetical protein